MSGMKRAVLVVISVMSLMVLPLVAAADEGEDPATTGSVQGSETLIEYVYHTVLKVLVFGFDDPEAVEPIDCELPEGAAIEIGEDGQIEVIGGELPEGCSAVSIEGPAGQVNHGTFMSSLVHAIRATFDGDSPFGHYVRSFARSGLGKGDDQVKGAGEDEEEPESAEPADDRGPKSERGRSAEARDKDKKAKGPHGNGRR